MTSPSDDVHDCARCGARTFGAACDCAEVPPAAHEVQRLFEPAPVQMDGQLTMGDA